MSDSLYLSRRALLTYLTTGSAGLLLPQSALAALSPQPEKTLALYNLHTGESLSTTFCSTQGYDQGSLAAINKILRDHRSNQQCAMDIELLEVLFQLREKLDTKQPLHIISGYRSPETNKMLSQKSNGVAKKSLHMQGKAIDIRVPGVALKDLHQAALSLQAGGVGLYTKSDFLHLDVGRVRRWGK
ncbi:YcbK family protein [Pontibacter sp. JAM-7]|uniref:YcbK family protein n=1 Tax=Pontibacter sp. JAM-7 TaxID=3366581 RepID=UPI003AF624EA